MDGALKRRKDLASTEREIWQESKEDLQESRTAAASRRGFPVEGARSVRLLVGVGVGAGRRMPLD